jgi:hypothetical protein
MIPSCSTKNISGEIINEQVLFYFNFSRGPFLFFHRIFGADSVGSSEEGKSCFSESGGGGSEEKDISGTEENRSRAQADGQKVG